MHQIRINVGNGTDLDVKVKSQEVLLSIKEENMTIICGSVKNGSVAISCDTQSNYGNLQLSSSYIINSNKLYYVNDSIIGFSGWASMADALEHYFNEKSQKIKLDNRMEIFSSFKKLHKKLIDNYYIEVTETEDQPMESSQLSLIIINKNGLFEVGSYREVNQFHKYWAIGSGQELALGAMYAVYETEDLSAKDIVEIVRILHQRMDIKKRL